MYASADKKRIDDYVAEGYLEPEYQRLTDAKRDQMRQAFEAGGLRRVIATKTWGTGVNFVDLDILVYASGEAGEIPIVQWGGRVTRTRAGKEFGVIIDCDDRFSEWALTRARRRVSQYRKLGWKVVQPELENAGNYKQARLGGM